MADHPRLPPWIRTTLPEASAASKIHTRTYAKGLATVCKEARCPNRARCSEKGTATFLILGDTCTRNCAFCAVSHGVPLPVSADEPTRVAGAVLSLGLRHAVITSVTRDDLPDGGASVFADTVRAIRSAPCGATIEILIPDFQGSEAALQAVIDSGPDVINHNLETVPRLYPAVRQKASYERSLRLLERVRERAPQTITKSGMMVGLGENQEELMGVFHDLAQSGCSVLTIGQYLRPTPRHHPVQRFLHPAEFEALRDLASGAGIRKVVSGPLVRSSFNASEILDELRGCQVED
jgi:lipoic acid synthetase